MIRVLSFIPEYIYFKTQLQTQTQTQLFCLYPSFSSFSLTQHFFNLYIIIKVHVTIGFES